LNPKSTEQFLWLSPKGGTLRDYGVRSSDARKLGSLEELRSASGQEAHGIEVDYDIFENLRPPAADQPHAIYHARDLNFRLKPGSKPVNAGVRLPNVNDGYAGTAPDLGAYEVGQAEPVYGPRSVRGER
jgi:hypothetical protein